MIPSEQVVIFKIRSQQHAFFCNILLRMVGTIIELSTQKYASLFIPLIFNLFETTLDKF
jgi:hypothetical protein